MEQKYAAFISYRHLPLDKRTAERVEKAIERYRVPRELREKAGGKRLGQVFRDEDELPASANLSDVIAQALERSRFLIVICTPDLPKSKWCEEEIRSFMAANGAERVLAVLADGTPEKSFSPYMLHDLDEDGRVLRDREPLAANLTESGGRPGRRVFRKEVMRIIAAIIGCPFDTLWQRERRTRLTRAAAALGAAAAALTVFLGLILSKNAQITERNREITLQNEEITEQYRQIEEQNGRITEQYLQIEEQNGQITRQNEQILQQNRSLQRQMSAALVDAGRAKLEDYRDREALEDALNALPEDLDPELYDHRAETLLNDALHAGYLARPVSSLCCSQTMAIAAIAAPVTGDRVLLADAQGNVRCVDPDTGTEFWTVDTLGEDKSAGDDCVRLVCLDDCGLALCKNTSNLTALSLEDGSIRWRYEYRMRNTGLYWSGSGNNFFVLSEDGRIAAILEGETDGKVDRIALLDTASGDCLGEIPLELGGRKLSLDGDDPWYQVGGSCSPDGKLLGLALYTYSGGGEAAGEAAYLRHFLVYDTETLTLLRARSQETTGLYSYVFCGLSVDPETGDLFCAEYRSSNGSILSYALHWAEDSLDQASTHHMPRTVSGLFSDLAGELSILPVLSDDRMSLVFCDNAIFLFNTRTAVLRKNFLLEGKVLYAGWLDREKEIVEVLLEDGWYGYYDFSGEGEYAVEGYALSELDQSGIRLGIPFRGGLCRDEERGMYLTVREAAPGELLGVKLVTDPEMETVTETAGFYASQFAIRSTPEGNTLVCLPGESFTALLMDPQGREVKRCVYETIGSGELCVLDEERFFMGKTLFGLDGSVEVLQGVEDPFCYPSEVSHARLEDGTVLSAYAKTGSFYTQPLRFWLNGEAIPTGEEELHPGKGAAAALGGNGFFLLRGGWIRLKGEEAREETGFLALEPVSGRELLLEDPHPEEPVSFAPGTSAPVAACAYGNGEIWLFSLDDGSARELPSAYAPGEVLSLRYAPGDGLLLVLTATERLDIWSADGECLFSQNVRNEGYSSMKLLRFCGFDREAGRLHVLITPSWNYGCWLCIDTSAWNVTAEAENVFAWAEGEDAIYAYTYNGVSRLVRFPMRSLAELRAWGEETLGR